MKIGLMIIITLVCVMPRSLKAQDGLIPITAENITDLEPGYALPGVCGVVTSDDRLMAVRGYGVYDLYTGQEVFQIGRGKQALSPDGRYLAVMNDGVYDLSTSEKLFAIAGKDTTYHSVPKFSSNGQYLAVVGDHLYHVPFGEPIISIPSKEREVYSFSPDSSLIAITGQGVYETATGNFKFFIDGFTFGDEDLEFSPDGKYLTVTIDGIYDVNTGARLIDMSAGASFSPDSQLVVVGKKGLYTLDPFEKVMDLSAYYTVIFDPSGTRIIAGTSAGRSLHFYDAETQKLLFTFDGYGIPLFNTENQWIFFNRNLYDMQEGTLLLEDKLIEDGPLPLHPSEPLFASYFGVFDLNRLESVPVNIYYAQNKSFTPGGTFLVADISTSRGRRCMVYGIKGNPWPMRHGIASPNLNIYIRNAPNGNVVGNTGSILIVQGYSTLFDKDWYLVGDDEWVASWVVDISYLPEDLPYITE